MTDNVSAVPEPVRGEVGVFGVERTGWVEGSGATEARNGLLAVGTRRGGVGAAQDGPRQGTFSAFNFGFLNRTPSHQQ